MNAARENVCGCCDGLRHATPRRIVNRPSLARIDYRSGDYASFRRSMLAGLTRSDRPALAGLATRDADDLSIALIDAWAVAADVLTFAIERTATEHYLTTATERGSIDAMSRLIGYRLAPGIAATTWLAFSLDTSPGSPPSVTVDTGARVQSVPGPGETPQTFETTEDLVALVTWNRPVPRLTRSRVPQAGDTEVWLAGAALALEPGDLLLAVSSGYAATNATKRWDLRRIAAVSADPATERTRVTWKTALAGVSDPDEPQDVEIHVLRQRASLFGHNAPDPSLFVEEVKSALGDKLNSDGSEWVFADVSEATLYLDSQYRGLAPGGWVYVNDEHKEPIVGPIVEVGEAQVSGYGLSGRVTSLTLPADVSEWSGSVAAHPRATTVLLGSERLTRAEEPWYQPVAGARIELDSPVDPIDIPRKILLRGRRAQARAAPGSRLILLVPRAGATSPWWWWRVPPGYDPLPVKPDETLTVLSWEPSESGEFTLGLRTADLTEGRVTVSANDVTYLPASADSEPVSEVAVVTEVSADGRTLTLAAPLAHVYDRPGVEIWGNVAAASHGESVDAEVLGSGDGTKTFQQFTLRRSPLTHLRDAGGATAASLDLYVNGVQWEEVVSFVDHGPKDRIYVRTITDDGDTVVTFGDGVQGARLPTGRDNVVARYRWGTGLDGQVSAGQLTLPLTRPLGVRGVTNPLAAGGAVPREGRDEARTNAPLTVLTLGRIVSLRDYADFALGYPGVAKAAVAETWDGSRRGVLLTVAGNAGAELAAGDPVYDGLLAAIRRSARDRVPLAVTGHRPVRFRVEASVVVDPDRIAEHVLTRVKDELSSRFSFEAGALGGSIPLSAVYEALHAVPGVAAATVTRLHRGSAVSLEPYVLAQAPVEGGSPGQPGAELLTLDPASLDDIGIATDAEVTP